ncbi:MAG: hypothetical protein JKY41_03270 [Rhodobacteraceae bacterium]|nr:hypothetical protein [Paracoccaceae bacterium]
MLFSSSISVAGWVLAALGWSLLLLGASSGEEVLGRQIINIHQIEIANAAILSGHLITLYGVIISGFDLIARRPPQLVQQNPSSSPSSSYTTVRQDNAKRPNRGLASQPGDRVKVYKGIAILKTENGVRVGDRSFVNVIEAEKYISQL